MVTNYRKMEAKEKKLVDRLSYYEKIKNHDKIFDIHRDIEKIRRKINETYGRLVHEVIAGNQKKLKAIDLPGNNLAPIDAANKRLEILHNMAIMQPEKEVNRLLSR